MFGLLNIGFLTHKVLKIEVKNFYITSFVGLFGTTILASVCAIFGRINIEFHLFLFLINSLILKNNFTAIKALYTNFYNQFKQLVPSIKYLFVILTILLLAQSATAPFIVDNESYYIQTIKWLNEYGFVKGVANLHPFLAVTSGWHITQSVFNFSFLEVDFNDLNGLTLWLLFGFSLQNLNTKLKLEKPKLTFLDLTPLLAVYLFQFVSAPSPDLPSYCCCFFVVCFFLTDEYKSSKDNFLIILILTLFSCYIKPTSAILLLFPLYLFLKNSTFLLSEIFRIIIVCTIVLTLFVIKNSITSGYPFFPILNFQFFHFDYEIPASIAQFYVEETKLAAFKCSAEHFNSISINTRFVQWLLLPGLHGFFNKIAVLFIIITPLFLSFFQNKKKYWIVYSIMTTQLIVLFFSSPQYRFYNNLILVFALVFIIPFLKNKKLIIVLNYLSIALLSILIVLPITLQLFTKNPKFKYNHTFSIQNITIPHTNSNLLPNYDKLKKANLVYYSPTQKDLFWEIGNATLPATNKNLVSYFEKYFGFFPQLRTDNIEDGFYAKNKK